MNVEEKLGSCPNLEEILRSDYLPQLVALMDELPTLKPLFPKLLQLRLVADANRVHGELRWRLRRRRKTANRSSIHEAIDAGVVVLFTPLYMKTEIEKHYEEIAEDTGTTVAEVEHEWKLFQKHLCFHSPKSQPSVTETYADINDFPYLATWKELDTQAIYTTDPHLAQMGAPVISVLIDTRLRDYARASTVQIGVGIGSSISAVVGGEFLRIVYRLLVRCIASIRQLPPAVQIALAGAFFVYVAHPKSRAKLQEVWNSLKNSKTVLALCDAIVDLGSQVAAETKKARDNYESLQAVIPTRQKRPLLLHARSVCTATCSALTLEELEQRIRRGGYVTRSQTFRPYLRRVLRADTSFIELVPGRWTVDAVSSRATRDERTGRES